MRPDRIDDLVGPGADNKAQLQNRLRPPRNRVGGILDFA
jgi:hypothetical protein